MHDPIVGLNNQGLILFANDEALKIIGLKTEEVFGKLAATLALRNDFMKSIIVSDFQNKSRKVLPMKIFADGKESYFEKEIVNITIKPTGEDQTIDIGNVIILRNITVFKELDDANPVTSILPIECNKRIILLIFRLSRIDLILRDIC